MLDRDFRDILSGVFIAFVGILFALIGMDYNFGSASQMGPGYMPVVLGWVLFFMGVLILLPACFRKGERITVHWDSLAASLASLVVFAFMLNMLGVFFSTVISVLIASIPKPMSIFTRFALSIAIAVITCLIFIAGLDMTVAMFPNF